MVIVHVVLEVLGQVLDVLYEGCDLNLGEAGVAFVGDVFGDDLISGVLARRYRPFLMTRRVGWENYFLPLTIRGRSDGFSGLARAKIRTFTGMD